MPILTWCRFFIVKLFFQILLSLFLTVSNSSAQTSDTLQNFYLLQEDYAGLRKNTLVEVTEETDFKVKLQVYRYSFEDGRHKRQPAFTKEVEKKDFAKKFYNARLTLGENNEAVLLHPIWTDTDGNPRKEYIVGASGKLLFCPPPNATEGIVVQVNEIIQKAEKEIAQNQDQRSRPSPEDFFIVSQASVGLVPNTLVQVTHRSETHATILIYKYTKTPEGFSREVVDEQRISLIDLERSFEKAKVEVSNDQFVFIHPYRVDENGDPRREVIQISKSKTPATEPNQEVAHQSNPIEAPSRPADYAKIRSTLNADIDWFYAEVENQLSLPSSNLASEQFSGTSLRQLISEGLKAPSKRSSPASRIASAQARVIRSVLDKMATESRFEGEEGKARASRLFAALTMYGEFRRRDKPSRSNPVIHRSLPHLFWAYQTMKNRAPRWDWGAQVTTINPQYDPNGRISRQFEGGLVSVVLSSYQYSAWNPGDANLSAILLADNGVPFQDISDVIAGVDAGLIYVDPKEENPRITHYISPASLGGPKPKWWNTQRFVLFEAKDLPRVVRSDQINKNSVESAKDATFEYYVDPRWFEGAREER